MSEKLAIARPSISTIRSCGRKPAASAALPGCTASMRGASTCRPPIHVMAAKTRIARMKFATGPAATTAALDRSGFDWKLCSRSAADIAASAASSGTLAAFMSPMNLT